MYVRHLEKRRTKFEIVDKKEETDGSLIVKIKKRYNTYSTEGYID